MDFKGYREMVIEEGKKAFDGIIKEQPEEITNKTPLMIEYARYGNNYENNHNVKFMVVGRAAGKFEEKSSFSVINYDNLTIDNNIIETCFDEQHNNDHLEWIHKPQTERKRYERCLDSKAFYRFAKRVYLKLTNQTEEIEWFKNICHSNIYKITSTEGGNPSWQMKLAQEDKMLNIMECEFKKYNPTHILVIDSETDAHCWCPEEHKNRLRKYASDCGAKIWFSNRPERKSKKALNEMFDRIDKDFWEIK